jgi:hypothetical protein
MGVRLQIEDSRVRYRRGLKGDRTCGRLRFVTSKDLAHGARLQQDVKTSRPGFLIVRADLPMLLSDTACLYPTDMSLSDKHVVIRQVRKSRHADS